VTAAPDREAAEVFDLGYRPYAGSREGRARAIRVMWVDSIRASLGLGRSLASKLLPIGIIGIAFFPAVMMMIIHGFIASFGGDAEEFGLPSNAEYYQISLVPLVLFGAALGPEMFCPDRRSGVLVLYFVRPITVRDYLIARWIGFFTVSIAILWMPQLLLYLTRAFTAENPWEWMQDHPRLLLQIALSGMALAALLTTVSLAVSSFTDRRPYAAASIIGLLLGSTIVAAIVVGVSDGAWKDRFELLQLLLAVDHLNDWIFQEQAGPLPPWAYIGQLLAIVGAGLASLWWRFRGFAS